MVRVLHVVASMNRGGVETFIMNLYRNIDRSSIQFDFITQSNKECDYDNEIYNLGGKIYRLPKKNSHLVSYIKQLIKIITDNPEYKIVHIHTDGASSIIDTICLMLCGIKVRIVHSHNTSTKRGKIHRILRPILASTSTHKFACSEEAGRWLFGNKSIEKGRVEFIANGIEIEKFLYNKQIREVNRKKLDIEGKYVVGHIGRFNKQKNHEFLIDIFNELHQKRSNALLLLIGRGELEANIKGKVKQLGLEEHVRFLGVREDTSELLQAMDIFLFPSLYEGLPLTLIEAQASGLTIFKSDTITKQVEITNLIKNISLDLSAREWSEKILEVEDFKHEFVKQEIGESEFNIKNGAKKLTAIYKNV